MRRLASLSLPFLSDFWDRVTLSLRTTSSQHGKKRSLNKWTSKTLLKGFLTSKTLARPPSFFPSPHETWSGGGQKAAKQIHFLPELQWRHWKDCNNFAKLVKCCSQSKRFTFRHLKTVMHRNGFRLLQLHGNYCQSFKPTIITSFRIMNRLSKDNKPIVTLL